MGTVDVIVTVHLHRMDELHRQLLARALVTPDCVRIELHGTGEGEFSYGDASWWMAGHARIEPERIATIRLLTVHDVFAERESAHGSLPGNVPRVP